MLKILVLVLLVLSSIFAVPVSYSSHNACGPGFIETIDPETGYSHCVFEEKVVEETTAEITAFEFADYQEHIELVINSREQIK